MSGELPITHDLDNPLSRFREYVAAGIAVLIVVTGLGMVLYVLLRSTTADKDTFERAKDMLLFINPLLGLVIGYYFNKVSTEGRAESAEKTARNATVASAQAMDESKSARLEAESARGDANKIRVLLKDLGDATSKILGEDPEEATL